MNWFERLTLKRQLGLGFGVLIAIFAAVVGFALWTDARLVRATALRVQEASLTGESEPVLKDAATLAAGLREQGVIVRHFKQQRIAQFLRITIGTPEQNQALLDALQGL